MALHFRNYQGPRDLEAQYELWLRATENLPYAWRSSLANVLALGAHVPRHPQSRLFAERDGHLVGYIGTHAPFRWEGQGVAIPFGFPWTHPQDGELEVELYDRMLAATPSAYPDHLVDFYIQRFRGSWKRHHEFLQNRAWREAWRQAILARPVGLADIAGIGSRPLRESDLDEAAALVAADPGASGPVSADALARRFDGGWCSWDSAWLVPGRGILAIEVRHPWAEVKLFAAAEGCMAPMLAELDRRAAERHAGVAYFTLGREMDRRRRELELRGFGHVDDDVYVRLDRA